MTQKDLTENVTLYTVRNHDAMILGSVIEDGYEPDEPVPVGIGTPELTSVVAAKVSRSRKTFTVAGQYGLQYLDGWHRTPADAWAAWRKEVEAHVAAAEQHVKDLREYLNNGLKVAELGEGHHSALRV